VALIPKYAPTERDSLKRSASKISGLQVKGGTGAIPGAEVDKASNNFQKGGFRFYQLKFNPPSTK
jgi:hypothetical protein